jgi:hypothetical protein
VRDIRHHTILTSDLPQGSTWVRYGLRMTTEPGLPDRRRTALERG